MLAGQSYKSPLGGIVCFSGWPALKEDLVTRVRGGANAQTPVFIGHGEDDGVVLPECGAKSAALLTEAGVKVTYNTYPRLAHGSSDAEMVELREWLKEVLKL